MLSVSFGTIFGRYNLRALPGVPDAFFEEADNGDGDDTALIDRVALWEALYRRFRLPALPAGADPGASFYHMCQGYDAGYYGYIWSEVRFPLIGVVFPGCWLQAWHSCAHRNQPALFVGTLVELTLTFVGLGR